MRTAPISGLRGTLGGSPISIGLGAVLTVVAGILVAAGGSEVVRFIAAGLALAALAAVIGEAIEAVGDRLGPGTTGLLQSTLGNLPELFVGIFALRAGLLVVVRAALVGSILGNAVLVLGCAFLAGGLRHGTQKFDPEEPRLYGSLLLVAVGAMLVPTLASHLSTPAAHHTTALSDVCAAVLLAVYACSIPYTLRRSSPPSDTGASRATSKSPFLVPLIILVAASAAAAFVSSWFVDALQPATRSMGITETFTGLVVVAIAANAVEHAVGIRFALRAKPEYAVSTTLSSPLQVALLLVPVLVLLSNLIGPHPLTLDFPTLLVAALAISAVVMVSVVFDGEYTWIEGVALIGLYVMLASGFWWG